LALYFRKYSPAFAANRPSRRLLPSAPLDQHSPWDPLEGEFNSGNSPELLFYMYSKAAEDGDDKMVDHWLKYAEGVLIFVSLRRVRIDLSLCITTSANCGNSHEPS
jgi:hypothetical protein